jgi:hypothetical protein
MREYHHMGIPTDVVQKDEVYHEGMKFYSTPFLNNEYRIQWHRFDKDCELHELLKKVPHVAFKVDSIEKEITGKKVILGPYEPIQGYRVAIIDFEGVPIEFIETTLSDEELASRSEKLME